MPKAMVSSGESNSSSHGLAPEAPHCCFCLTQDVEDDQTKLAELEASLPSKAEEMGMVPQKGALTIDLNGYQPSGDDVQ